MTYCKRQTSHISLSPRNFGSTKARTNIVGIRGMNFIVSLRSQAYTFRALKKICLNYRSPYLQMRVSRSINSSIIIHKNGKITAANNQRFGLHIFLFIVRCFRAILHCIRLRFDTYFNFRRYVHLLPIAASQLTVEIQSPSVEYSRVRHNARVMPSG